MLQNTLASSNAVGKALLCLMTSAFLFSIMGVCIRFASETVDNPTVVFFRNAVGLIIFIPMLLKHGLSFIKTQKLWMHTWRSIVGLAAMYGFSTRLHISNFLMRWCLVTLHRFLFH